MKKETKSCYPGCLGCYARGALEAHDRMHKELKQSN